MKLLIEIPDQKYNTIIDKTYCGIYDPDIYNAISKGRKITGGGLCDLCKMARNWNNCGFFHCKAVLKGEEARED